VRSHSDDILNSDTKIIKISTPTFILLFRISENLGFEILNVLAKNDFEGTFLLSIRKFIQFINL